MSLSLSFFEHAFTFWHKNIFWAYLVLSLLYSWNQAFLYGTLDPFSGK